MTRGLKHVVMEFLKAELALVAVMVYTMMQHNMDVTMARDLCYLGQR